MGVVRKILLAAASLALVGAPLVLGGPARALPGPLGSPALPAACDWPMFGHDLGRSFAATPDGAQCPTVSPLTASTLHPKWHVATNSPVTAQPAVTGNRVYVGDFDGIFRSIDADTGDVKWTFDVNQTDQSANDYGKIVSSAAVTTVGGRQVVVLGGGATLYVLDAADTSAQRVLGSACVDPTHSCASSSDTVEIESSPAVVDVNGSKRVVVGMDFNEDSGVGRAGVIELALGDDGSISPLWKFDPETLQTYRVDPLHAGGIGYGCGNVWSSPAVDTAHNLVVFGVGNCDDQNHAQEPGDGEATVAISIDTGDLVWRNAPRVWNNGLDLDFGATPNVLPGGRVGEGGKDGKYYSYAADGTTTAGFPAAVSTGSDIGGMIGSTAVGMAGDRPAIFASSAFPFSTREPDVSFQENLENPGHATGLHAIDATTGEKLWDAPAAPAYGAAVYAGGVVFVPDTFTFSLQAYDAATGAPLWAFPTGGPPSSPPAVVGRSVYAGAGTDVDGVGGIWGFETAA